MASPFMPPLGPPRATWLTAPVEPMLWPASRTWTQIVSGIFLTVMFGIVLLASPFAALTAFIGVITALPLAATVNGVLVWRRRRRLTFVSVLLFLFILPLVTAPVLPPLNAWGRALLYTHQGETDKLRGLLLDVERADLRYGPARSAAAAGLHAEYVPLLGKLDAAPLSDPADRPLREAFRQLLEEGAEDPDATVYVRLTEKIDLTIPPEAKLDLALFMVDPDFQMFARVPVKPAELDAIFRAADAPLRASWLGLALARQFGPRIEVKLLRFKGLEPGETTNNRRVLAVHADIKHSGRYLKTKNMFGPPSLTAQPKIMWTISTISRQGVERKGASLTPELADRFNLKQDFNKAGEYSPLLSAPLNVVQADLRCAWELARRLGFDAGPEPVSFP